MTDARSEILQRVRRALSSPGLDANVSDSPGPTPAAPSAAPFAGRGAPGALSRTLATALVHNSATVAILKAISALPAEVERYLAAVPCRTTIAVADHPVLTALDWRPLATRCGHILDGDLAAVTWARGALADTGTLVFESGVATPTPFLLLPDISIVVVEARDIRSDLGELWAQYATAERALPRALNLVSGPSRTADIEQTLTLGAHGPRSLHVVILDSA